jgi:hypothetical protein
MLVPLAVFLRLPLSERAHQSQQLPTVPSQTPGATPLGVQQSPRTLED